MAIWTYSGNVYNSSPQGTTVFPLTSMQGNSIEYLQRSHIHVYSSVNQGTDYVELSTPADYGFNAEGTEIVLTSGIATGTWIKLQRITPYLDEYVQFQASSQLTAGQLNTGELFSMYVDQELFDQFALLNSVSIKYLGAIDLTVDAAPATPEGGDFYINTGAGIVVASWTGIAGDLVVGSEQVVYNAITSEWEIYAVPSSQVGVVEVKGTAPIDVDATDNQRPVVSITDATQSNKGSLSAADKTKLDNYPVIPPNGTTIGPTPPPNPVNSDQWWDSDDGRGYVYYEDADSSQWVEMNPSWNGSVADGSVTPPKLSTGGPSWDTSGNLTVDGKASFAAGATNISSAGIVAVSRTATTNDCFEAQLNGVATCTIKADGTTVIGGTLPATPNITLNTNGSAKFAAGATNISSSGIVSADRTASTNDCFTASLNGVTNCTIKAGGSATFGGVVYARATAGGPFAALSPTSGFTCYNGTGNTFTVSTSGILQLGTAISGQNGNIRLYGSSGSAEFAGNITAGDYPTPTAYISASSVLVNANPKTATKANSGVSIYQDGVNNGAVVLRNAAGAANVILSGSQGTGQFSGNVTAANVSDIRFKENITDAKPQLADVVALGSQLKNWDWKEEAPLNDELKAKRFLGLVAQESEKICPDIAYTVKRIKTMEVTPAVIGPKGRVITEAVTQDVDDNFKAINHDILVMKLLGAVAEQNARIEALEAKVQSLEKGTN